MYLYLHQKLYRISRRWNEHAPSFIPKICEGGGGPCYEISFEVKPESSRTMYHWDGKGEDPNRCRWLCRPCAKMHHEHWDDMWSNVPGYSSW